jgi:hypothetical protein
MSKQSNFRPTGESPWAVQFNFNKITKKGKTKMINLSKFEPKPPKFKRVFKKHGISLGTIANYLGLSYPYVCNMLNGIYRMTPKVEMKLQKLVGQLEDENIG